MRIKVEKLSSRFEVRQFTEMDIPAVYALCKGNPTYYKHMKMEPTPDNLKSVLTELPSGKTIEDKLFAGFYEEGSLTAILDLITGYPDADTALIGWFMMDKMRQGRGIGSGIVEDISACLKKEGFSYVRLGYIKGNAESEGFWKKNGFVPTGEEVRTDDYTIIVMKKSL